MCGVAHCVAIDVAAHLHKPGHTKSKRSTSSFLSIASARNRVCSTDVRRLALASISAIGRLPPVAAGYSRPTAQAAAKLASSARSKSGVSSQLCDSSRGTLCVLPNRTTDILRVAFYPNCVFSPLKASYAAQLSARVSFPPSEVSPWGTHCQIRGIRRSHPG